MFTDIFVFLHVNMYVLVLCGGCVLEVIHHVLRHVSPLYTCLVVLSLSTFIFVRICMTVFLRISKYVCICIYVCISIYTHKYVNIKHSYVSIYVYICIWKLKGHDIYKYIYTHMYIYTYWKFIYMYICVCHIFTCLCISMYHQIRVCYIHIHICTHFLCCAGLSKRPVRKRSARCGPLGEWLRRPSQSSLKRTFRRRSLPEFRFVHVARAHPCLFLASFSISIVAYADACSCPMW